MGGGSSFLVDMLVGEGRRDVTVLDHSGVALDTVRARTGADPRVSLVQGNLLEWTPPRRYDLWHDRAVFHFLVEPGERAGYLERLQVALRPGGTVILATFAPDGPASCSGLPVARYSPADLVAVLGPGFRVIEAFREEHVTPTGVTQPFSWVATRRMGT